VIIARQAMGQAAMVCQDRFEDYGDRSPELAEATEILDLAARAWTAAIDRSYDLQLEFLSNQGHSRDAMQNQYEEMDLYVLNR
jgi:hypothetical protein